MLQGDRKKSLAMHNRATKKSIAIIGPKKIMKIRTSSK
jgi:hypothetical protein